MWFINLMPSLKRLLVARESEIHGLGLFSTIEIPKGTLIGKCKARKTMMPGLHTLWLDDGNMVDILCRLRLINHSKKPNVAYLNNLSVISLRRIRPGEELTHDYGDAWD